MKKQYLLLILVLALIFNVGCSGGGSTGGAKSTVVQDEFLMYVSENFEDSTGSLYLQKPGKEKDKLSSDVYFGSFRIMPNNKSVLFLDKENNLYIKKPGKDTEKEKITSEVVPFSYISSADESTIAFLRDESELYIKESGKEKEKITTGVYNGNYSLSPDGKILTYLDEENNLYIKHSGKEKEKIASDIYYYYPSADGQTIAFLNDEEALYVRKLANQDKQKVTSEKTANVRLSENGETIAFLSDYNYEDGKGELYLYTAGKEKQKVASDVTDYDISVDGKQLYYLNEEKSLYLKETDKDKEKLSSEVTDFRIYGDGEQVVFTNEDENLYLKEKGKEKEKLGNDVKVWDFYNGQVVYLTNDNDLYMKKSGQEKQKLAADVEEFTISPNDTGIAWYNKGNELYFKKGTDKETKVIDNIREYNEIYLLNSLLFQKSVTIDDIAGIWDNNIPEDRVYLEFTKEGKCIGYFNGENQGQKELKISDATPRTATLTLTDNETGESLDFFVEVQDKDTLIIDGETCTRMTREELDKALAAQKDQLALQTKIDQSDNIGYDLLYTNVTVPNNSTQCYTSINGAVVGTADLGSEFYIDDYVVEEDGTLWLLTNAYNHDTGYYEDVWFKYDSIK